MCIWNAALKVQHKLSENPEEKMEVAQVSKEKL